MDVIQSLLTEYDLSKLPSWESELTDLTTPVLMLVKISAITAAGASRYGVAKGTTLS